MKKAIISTSLAGALMLFGLPLTAQQADSADPSEQVFAGLDSDRDGKLSQAEFSKMLDQNGQQVSDQDKENEFKAWDANTDGSISKEEFKANYNADPQGNK